MRSVRAAGLFASRLISDRPYKSSSSQTVLNCWMSLTSFLLCPFQPLYVREALRDCSWRSCDLPRPKVDQEGEWEVLIGALTLKTQWLEPGWRRQNAILINVLINSQNLEKNLFKFFFFFSLLCMYKASQHARTFCTASVARCYFQHVFTFFYIFSNNVPLTNTGDKLRRDKLRLLITPPF